MSTLWKTSFIICSRRLGVGPSGEIETGKRIRWLKSKAKKEGKTEIVKYFESRGIKE